MFELRDVCLHYGARPILDRVGARVEPGHFTAVIGPNGAGKSTLLRVMTGEVKPTSGTASFEGRPLGALSPAALASRRAVLPQSAQLAFPFTVLEVVRLGLEARPGLDAQARRTVAQEALVQVDLEGFGGRRYQQLSGGEQQRVHLARVLCQAGGPMLDGRPQYLFLDEPTSSLDIRHQLGMLALARRFADAGGGVFAILHDLNLAAMFADRLIAMHAGAVAAAGTPREVLTDDVLRTVFGVPLKMGLVPEAETLFVLPQSAGA